MRVPAASATGVRPATIDLPWIPSSASLAGRVLDAASGAPIANRPVLVFLRDPGVRDREPWISVTDAEGRYEFSELPGRPLTVSYRLGRKGHEGQLEDPESPWPEVRWDVTPAVGVRIVHDVSVPRVRGEGAEEPSIALEASILESGTCIPLAGATVHVEVARGDQWIVGGSFRSDERGTASGRVLSGDRYRLLVWRARAGTGETHETQTVDATATRGHLDVEVVLEPKASDRR